MRFEIEGKQCCKFPGFKQEQITNSFRMVMLVYLGNPGFKFIFNIFYCRVLKPEKICGIAFSEYLLKLCSAVCGD